ncbi:MAG: serine/threonine-protein kinase, partial [Holophagales bacterium]|nr:serine/threonine-protein kinase [Holophagales bacterium]
MNPELWQRAREVFLEVVELEEAGRAEAITWTCDDPALADAVRALLHGHEAEGSVDGLAEEVGRLGKARDRLRALAASGPGPGDRVGPFQILEQIGEGGMASVYRARRATDAFRQEVALKILGGHRPSPEALARFAFERQVAASLDHPNIAKLIDGGVTPDGRPYFALELVEGRPIDVFCDEEKLSVEERVGLVADVAHAVHHAHKNLLVHRDLKPSNILVDRDGRVRLLDFGIAKALDPEVVGADRTQTGARLLTPHYASPEQLTGGGITTASDQYQLGLLLFELVSGHCHHLLDGDDFRSMARRISFLESPRPSKLLNTAVASRSAATGGRSLEEIAAERGVTAHELSRQLDGDLDTILLAALDKDPNRRYSSVEAFADDLARFLGDQPVRARRSSLPYRMSKLIRRHRAAAAAIVLGVVALAAGTALATWQAVRATKSGRVALEHAATADKVSTFLVDLFRVTDPGTTAGERLTADEILELGREQLLVRLDDQPRVRGRLLLTVSQIHHNLGDFDNAAALAEEAIVLHEAESGPRASELADALFRLAETRWRQEKLSEAAELYQRSLEIREAAFGRRSLEVAESLSGLGV